MKKFFIFLAIIVALTAVITIVSPANSLLLCLVNLIVVALYLLSMPQKSGLQPAVEVLQPSIGNRSRQSIISPKEEIKADMTCFNGTITVTSLSEQGKHAGIIQRMSTLMEVEKIYQETELTLHQLANKLQVPAYLVSQALNEGMNRNFYDLVNGHRVEEAKRLLLDTKNVNYTILSVGFEAGFNSKTTFNTVFKKFTGLTPSEYRNKFRQLSIAA